MHRRSVRRSHVLSVVNLRVLSPARVIAQSRWIEVFNPPEARPAELPDAMMRTKTRMTAQRRLRAASSAGVRITPGAFQADFVASRSGMKSTAWHKRKAKSALDALGRAGTS